MRTRDQEAPPARESAGTPTRAIGAAPRRPWSASPSGPAVATLFHRLLSAVFVVAWLSLSSQILLLIGSRGLLPLADFAAAPRAEGALSFFRFPTLLAWIPDDRVLHLGTWLGLTLGLLGLFGWRPRLCAGLQTAWYLGYATACRSFLGFQWDNLLLECGLLAAFLPRHRGAPLAHFLLRALLFKLYFESGLAKWQSPLHDWRDGSAMTFYYETAPLPTALAWFAHHLPRGWHHFESYATLFLELALPFAIFAPRRGRLLAAAGFTLFQVINAATANYGFFCYLTVALHVFLLDESDLTATRSAFERLTKRFGTTFPSAVTLAARVRRLLPNRRAIDEEARPNEGSTRRLAAWTGMGIWILFSLTQAWFHFGEPKADSAVTKTLVPVLEWAQTFRVVNAYHLFTAVTRERIEPEFQTQGNDGAWTAHDLHYKPGSPRRSPGFVAPHQPRVDFLLWFYGLGSERRQPIYVATLLGRLCEDPSAVAALFVAPLPAAPSAVRMVFWNYRFTSAAERRETGSWWRRSQLGSTTSLPCRSP